MLLKKRKLCPAVFIFMIFSIKGSETPNDSEKNTIPEIKLFKKERDRLQPSFLDKLYNTLGIKNNHEEKIQLFSSYSDIEQGNKIQKQLLQNHSVINNAKIFDQNSSGQSSGCIDFMVIEQQLNALNNICDKHENINKSHETAIEILADYIKKNEVALKKEFLDKKLSFINKAKRLFKVTVCNTASSIIAIGFGATALYLSIQNQM
jgi:hypothetical protein